MATGFRVSVEGTKKLQRDLERLSPAQRKVTDPSLKEMASLVVRTAALEKIRRGGKGPPIAGKLTSRTGTLRGSLGINVGLDLTGLSRGFIEAGSSLVYAKVHEESTRFPRPFLRPALDQEIKQFINIFNKHWRRVAQV